MLEVKTYTYRNRDHRESNGECCDPIFWSCNDCDNIFIFCIRDANNRDDNADNCPLGRDSFKDYRDTINFPQDDSSIHSFTSQEPWPVSLKKITLSKVVCLTQQLDVNEMCLSCRVQCCSM